MDYISVGSGEVPGSRVRDTVVGDPLVLKPTEPQPQQELPFGPVVADAPLCSEWRAGDADRKLFIKARSSLFVRRSSFARGGAQVRVVNAGSRGKLASFCKMSVCRTVAVVWVRFAVHAWRDSWFHFR